MELRTKVRGEGERKEKSWELKKVGRGTKGEGGLKKKGRWGIGKSQETEGDFKKEVGWVKGKEKELNGGWGSEARGKGCGVRGMSRRKGRAVGVLPTALPLGDGKKRGERRREVEGRMGEERRSGGRGKGKGVKERGEDKVGERERGQE